MSATDGGCRRCALVVDVDDAPLYDEVLLQECALLYSENYSTWGAPAAKKGSRVCVTPSML